jgi:hypothetical protein
MAEQDEKDKPATGDGDGMTTDAGKAALKKERDRVRALEAELKDLKPLADAAKKAEDEKLGEVEKLTKQLAEANAKADANAAKADRYEVALEKGLNLTRAKRLVGTTRDELVADADELLADLGPADGKDRKDTKDSKPPSGKPAEHLRGGGDPDTTPPTDVRKVVDSIPRGF